MIKQSTYSSPAERAAAAFRYNPYSAEQLIRVAASLKGIRLNVPIIVHVTEQEG